MYTNYPDVDSIPRIHKRLCDEGYKVSVCTLRGWVRQGILPVAYAGKKALLYYPNVLKVLQKGTEPPEAVKIQMLRLMQQ